MSYCAEILADRRRPFWVTQPNACGDTPDDCGTDDCGIPGLSFDTGNCANITCCCPPASVDPLCTAHTPQRTIAANNWLRGLILNILSTRGRLPNTDCGYPVGAQGGHWTDSFRTDGQQAGNLIYSVPAAKSIRDSMLAIAARVQADLNKLVTMKVVSTVLVTATYAGGRKAKLDISAIAPSGASVNVGLTGTRTNNSWIWS